MGHSRRPLGRGSEPEDADRVIKESGPKKSQRDVFVYFDNDAKVRAPFDAKSLADKVNKQLLAK